MTAAIPPLPYLPRRSQPDVEDMLIAWLEEVERPSIGWDGPPSTATATLIEYARERRGYRARRAEYKQAQKAAWKEHGRGIPTNVSRVCEDCGRSAGGRCRLSAHHEDYSKPKEVVYLCAGCHTIRHRRPRPDREASP